jgi:hypothetical protein
MESQPLIPGTTSRIKIRTVDLIERPDQRARISHSKTRMSHGKERIMRSRKGKQILTITITLLLLLPGLACRKSQQQQPQLPEKAPQVAKQDFTDKSQGFPPKAKDRTNVSAVAVQESQTGLTDARAVQVRDAALQDAQVRNLLGARFAYITVDEIEPEKGQTLDTSAGLITRVTFFSYSNNAAVYVRMNGQKVESSTKVDGFQPPEGREEIKAAVALASRDDNLANKLQGLTGRAILSYTPEGQPGYGHRVMRVTFRNGDEDVPRYFAMVDLTDQRVLSSGAVRQ